MEPKEEEIISNKNFDNNLILFLDLDSDSSLFSQKDEFHLAQNFEQDMEDYEEKTKEIEKLINNLDEREKAKFNKVFKGHFSYFLKKINELFNCYFF